MLTEDSTESRDNTPIVSIGRIQRISRVSKAEEGPGGWVDPREGHCSLPLVPPPIVSTLSNILYGKLSLNSRNRLSKLSINRRKALRSPVLRSGHRTTQLGSALNDKNLWNLMQFGAECWTELLILLAGVCQPMCGGATLWYSDDSPDRRERGRRELGL